MTKVKIDLGGGALRIFLTEKGAAGQISLRNTDVSASHPSPGDNHQSTGEGSERTQGQAKMAS